MDLQKSWKGLKPSPIEEFHAVIMEQFHLYRQLRTDETEVSINGAEMNKIIVKAKKHVYSKYKEMNLGSPVPNVEEKP